MKTTYLKTMIGGGGVLVSYLFGGFDILFQTLLFFIVCDIVSGMIGALYHKKMNSKKMRRGIVRKAFELLFVTIAYRLDILTDLNMFRNFAVFYFIATEGLSILENIGKFIEYPYFVKKYLEQLKETSAKGDDIVEGDKR